MFTGSAYMRPGIAMHPGTLYPMMCPMGSGVLAQRGTLTHKNTGEI